MTLTPEQIAILVPVIVGLLLALTQYLQRQATKNDIAAVQTKVDDIHAVATQSPQVPPEANPFLKDGHELPPFVKPPRPPLP